MARGVRIAGADRPAARLPRPTRCPSWVENRRSRAQFRPAVPVGPGALVGPPRGSNNDPAGRVYRCVGNPWGHGQHRDRRGRRQLSAPYVHRAGRLTATAAGPSHPDLNGGRSSQPGAAATSPRPRPTRVRRRGCPSGQGWRPLGQPAWRSGGRAEQPQPAGIRRYPPGPCAVAGWPVCQLGVPADEVALRRPVARPDMGRGARPV
jgi:hypothetical protein